LAWIIYSSLSYFKGETFHDNSKFENGIAISDAGKKMGLKTGDRILKIDGRPAERMETSTINMLFASYATVLRNRKEVTFPINEDGVAEVLAQSEAKAYFSPRFPAIIDSLLPTGSAKAAGLLKGDKITGINGKPILFFDELSGELSKHKNQNIILDIERNGIPQKVEVKVDDKGKLGFSVDAAIAQKMLEKTRVIKKYSFLAAIPRGFQRTIDVLTMQVKQFKIIFNSKTQGYKKVSGPIGIIKQMPETINWEFFWSFTAMFSVWLAFLNLIPIPGLDGGHVVFTLWEMITRKPVPQKILENAQMIGVVFLLGLMALIFGNDIVKWVTGKF
jgi:regulator of sigma E protease